MRKTLLFCFILGLAGLLGAGLWPRLFLVVTDQNDHIRYFVRTSPGKQFTVRFTHSVAMRPVDEVYTIRPEGLQVTETSFDMTGAGLPASPLEGQTFTVEGDQFHITGFTVLLPKLTYRVARVVADHRFIMDSEIRHLSDWAAPGRPVTFSVRQTNYIACLVRSR